jgi:hypothetical protein
MDGRLTTPCAITGDVSTPMAAAARITFRLVVIVDLTVIFHRPQRREHIVYCASHKPSAGHEIVHPHIGFMQILR